MEPFYKFQIDNSKLKGGEVPCLCKISYLFPSSFEIKLKMTTFSHFKDLNLGECIDPGFEFKQAHISIVILIIGQRPAREVQKRKMLRVISLS